MVIDDIVSFMVKSNVDSCSWTYIYNIEDDSYTIITSLNKDINIDLEMAKSFGDNVKVTIYKSGNLEVEEIALV
jgi:hypothetical protein